MKRPLDLSLRRKSRISPWRSLAYRLLLVVALIGVVIAVHVLDRGGLRDNVDGSISIADILYFTAITITTVGYGDIVPVTERARLFDAFLVTPVRIFVWLIFLGTAYDFLFRRIWDRIRMTVIQNQLSGHLIVAGYGNTNSEAVRELCRRDAKVEGIVVIDCDATALADAQATGLTVLNGDATRNAVLEAVRIDRAAALIVSAGSDDTSILIVLTARRMAPALPISVVIRNEDNETLARDAGATTVINPVAFTGLLLAGSSQGPYVADYLSDLAGAHGAVTLRERTVRPEEVGRTCDAIATGKVLRLYRDGQPHDDITGDALPLQAGDVLVEVAREVR